MKLLINNSAAEQQNVEKTKFHSNESSFTLKEKIKTNKR